MGSYYNSCRNHRFSHKENILGVTTMKKILLLTVALCMISLNALAVEATFTWTANTEADLAGYKIHYGSASRSYTETVDVGNVTQHTMAVPDTAAYFAATAYDTAGNESGYSEEIVFDPPPDAPAGFTYQIVININIGGAE